MDFKDYIKGKREGKEANQLERKAMEDSFLQDAIDGYDAVEGSHLSSINNMERQLDRPLRAVSKRAWLYIAAILLLLIGIPFLLYQPLKKEEPVLASSSISNDTVEIAPQDMTEIENELRESLVVNSMPEILPIEEDIVAEQKESKQVTMSFKQPERIESQLEEKPSKDGDNEGELLVSGRIVDEKGNPLIGVSVYYVTEKFKGTIKGTTTDSLGFYELNIAENDDPLLTASYIGKESSDIPLKENAGDIVMREDNSELHNIQVIAFGRKKKTDQVGLDSVPKSTEQPVEDAVFGEKEFKEYFIKYYDKSICKGTEISFVVEFFVNPQGHPGNINIKENNCPALETEIKRLLFGSPLWSEVNKTVTLNIELPKK